jgi:hypothetical protein
MGSIVRWKLATQGRQIQFGCSWPNNCGREAYQQLLAVGALSKQGSTLHVVCHAETSAFLITFILLGKYLEASAKGRTSEAITKLLTRLPPVAILLTKGPDGEVVKEETVETSLIHRGDLLKVRLLFISFGGLNCCMLVIPSLTSIQSRY